MTRCRGPSCARRPLESPATFIRFAFGLPFAAAALALVVLASGHSAPSPNARFLAWVAMGAVTQVMSTAFFVAAMAQRTFVVAVVFTKTEVLQVALFAVGYRGAMLALGPAEPAWMKGVYGLVWAMAIQYRAASSASRCRASSAWGSSCCWRGSW